MLLASTVATAAYALLLLTAGFWARRAHARDAMPEEESLPFVSVLIAARNEEEHLSRCLEALAKQSYPPERTEIIVADDGSEDATAAVATAFVQRDPRFRLLRVNGRQELRGKARAIHQSIDAAKGELLLTTDADCEPPPDWVRGMVRQFDGEKVGVVSAATAVEHETLLDRLQALDWLLLLTVAAGAARARRPITAMGNNMAFRRETYDAVGGYPALPYSVTEDYALFRTVHSRTEWKVQLLLDRSLLNRTRPLPTLRDVFEQRRRWARGGLRAAPWVYLLYGCVYAVHALLPAALLLHPWPALALIAGKMGVDLTLVRVGQRATGQNNLLRSFAPFEIYYWIYILAMPWALLMRPRIRWKGRTS